jgi:hypothetical protein
MWAVEHTDTFGGQPNYCWVRRYTISPASTPRALVRAAKAVTGLTGVRCDVVHYGDMIEIRPRGLCEVVFVTWQDEDGEILEST